MREDKFENVDLPRKLTYHVEMPGLCKLYQFLTVCSPKPNKGQLLDDKRVSG